MTSTLKWLNIFVLLACPFFYSATHAESVLSQSVYKGSISGWKVEMVRTLKQTSDNRYELRSEAKNLFASIREVSEFEIKDEQIRPLFYLYERKVFGRNAKEEIAFDWPEGVAHYSRSDRPQNNTSHNIEPGILDPALYQLAMQAELAQGLDTFSYTFVKRKRIETYAFTTQPSDKLKIGKQTYDAEVVSREDRDKDKSTKIWVIPDLDHQVGQILHTDDGDTYQIRLAEYRGDSAQLKQLYARLAKLTPNQ
jgi:hypothetical protein